MHERIEAIAEPGRRKNDIAAEILRVGIEGLPDAGGDYPAIMPLLPSGPDASAAHLTWTDEPLRAGEGTFFEIAGCYPPLPTAPCAGRCSSASRRPGSAGRKTPSSKRWRRGSAAPAPATTMRRRGGRLLRHP